MRKLLLCLIFCVALGFGNSAFAQPDSLWSSTFGDPGTTLLGATSLSSGGFMVCGYVNSGSSTDHYVARLSSDGVALWDSVYLASGSNEQSFALVETGPDTLVVVGWGQSEYSLVLFSIKTDGSLLWSRSYTSPGKTKGYDIIKLADGNLGVLGYRQNSSEGHSDVWLLKCHSNGDTLWTRTFTQGGTETGTRIRELSNGHLAIAANTKPVDAQNNIWVFETDANGQMLAGDQTFGTDSLDVCYGFAMDETGNKYVGGKSVVTGNNFAGFLVNVPAAGTPWTNVYPGDGDKEFRGIIPRSGGAMVAGLNGTSFGSTSLLLAAFNEAGANDWEWELDPGAFYYLLAIPSGGSLAVGTRYQTGGNFAYVLRLDPPFGITGIVTEVESGAPVPNVRVQAIGTTRIAVTGFDGRYALEIPAGTYDLMTYGPCAGRDTIPGIVAVDGELVTADFTVGVPIYPHNHSSVNLIAQNHLQSATNFPIDNEGSGQLYFSITTATTNPPGAWLSASPPTGMVPAHSSFNVSLIVTADTADVGVFDYFGQLELVTNSCPDSVDLLPVIVSVLDAERPPDGLPTAFSLSPAYPNPFNPSTSIEFSLPQTTSITLELFDISGRFVGTPLAGSYSAGIHKVTLDLSSQATGLYFVRLHAGQFTASRKLFLLK